VRPFSRPLIADVMSQDNRRHLTAVIVLLAALALSSEVLACTCRKTTVPERVSEATTIFVARVVATSEIYVPDAPTVGREQVLADYVAVRTLKGTPRPKGQIRSAVYNGGLNCGLELMAGNSYVIFLYTDNYISVCGGSRLVRPWIKDHGEFIEEIARAVSTQ